MRVRYYTNILGNVYEGELLSVTVPVEHLKHSTGTDIDISCYDIQIKQDDGAKITLENVKLSDVHVVTNCIECKNCIIETNDNEIFDYSCRFDRHVGISVHKKDELHFHGVKCCGLFEKSECEYDGDAV